MGTLPHIRAHTDFAKAAFRCHCSQENDDYKMINTFRVYWETVNKIQRFYRRTAEAQKVRKLALLDMFEKEQKSMQKYYFDRLKKQKKLKQVHAALSGITKEQRDLVLKHYYMNKLTQENMIKTIYKCAKTYHKRGTVVNIRTGEYARR